jgi:glycerophosphodiester phosphodiesterase
VFDYAKDRPIIFSTFQPDAAMLVKKLQSIYPVSMPSSFFTILVKLVCGGFFV